MFDIQKTVDELKQWMRNHNIEERSRQYFFEYLKNYRESEREEFKETFKDFDNKKFTIRIQELGIHFNWSPFVFHYILIHIPIIYEDKDLGWYRLMFFLSGELYNSSWFYHNQT